MTGFEHQVASHMIWEDKLDYGLSILKAVHERYGAEKRNPYNEIECSDHYSRAMASYGAFIAACGFTYNGPKGQIGLDPKIKPENFKAAFTAAEGWGSIQQRRTATSQTNSLKLTYGKLQIQEIELALSAGKTAASVIVSHNNKPLEASFKNIGNKVIVVFESQEIKINEEILLRIEL
jgi:hypothetical protein